MNPAIQSLRGNFPKGPRGETVAQRRERYELWVLSTRAPQPDYEEQSIQFYRGKQTSVKAAPGFSSERKLIPAKPSRKLCVTSRCWQCEAGHDDANAHLRIGNCRAPGCGLWPVRPYQEYANAPPTKDGSIGDYKGAVREYCGQCAGGPNWRKHYQSVAQEVRLCPVVHCAIWPIRPGQTPEAQNAGGAS